MASSNPKRKQTIVDRFLWKLKHRYVTVISYAGKGGTGKTLTATNLAIRLSEQGFRVGLLDLDLEMNSVERVMGYRGKRVRRNVKRYKLIPQIYKGHPTLKMFSLSMMPFMDTKADQTILWGGEYQREYILQLLEDVDWGKLDVMIFDAPAGIGDTIMALTQIYKRIDYAVVTGLNNKTSTDGVSKAVTTLKDHKIKVLGVVANQAYYVCPHCHKKSYPLGNGGIKKMCEKHDVPFAGEVPLLREIYIGMEHGKPYVDNMAYDRLADWLIHHRALWRKSK